MQDITDAVNISDYLILVILFTNNIRLLLENIWHKISSYQPIKYFNKIAKYVKKKHKELKYLFSKIWRNLKHGHNVAITPNMVTM